MITPMSFWWGVLVAPPIWAVGIGLIIFIYCKIKDLFNKKKNDTEGE